MRSAALVGLLLWPLAAFGGAGIRSAFPFGAAALLAAVLVRPRVGYGSVQTVDRALIVLGAGILFQLLPLPLAVVELISPHAVPLKAAIAIGPYHSGGAEPLSINWSHTVWAALVTVACIAIFWFARQLFERGGVRRVVRAVCTIGMMVSVLAMAQAATAGRRIYWMFPTDYEGPLPFGPFVNRNHFATWVIMAVPLCLGYIAARADQRGGTPFAAPPGARLARVLEGRTVWLIACETAMVAALLLSLSRSGIAALGVAACLTLIVTRRRTDATRYWWFVAAGGTAAVAAVWWSDIGALTERLAAVLPAIALRWQIWAETLPIVRDFWWTGTGAGTYETAMLLYQRSDRLWYFNQAHNHYLQLAAEGGLLLCAPAVAALCAYARQAAACAREDRSGMFWIRAGALCGLTAAALQSLWETGLTMPANGALAAVLAALAVHQRPAPGR